MWCCLFSLRKTMKHLSHVSLWLFDGGLVKRMKYLSSQKICGLNLKSVGGRQQFGVARLVTTPDLPEPNTVLYHSKFQEHGCPNHPTPRRPLIRWALVAMGHAASTIFMFQPHQGKGFKVKPKFVMMFILQVPAFSERDLNVRNHTNLDRLDVTSRDLNCRLLTKWSPRLEFGSVTLELTNVQPKWQPALHFDHPHVIHQKVGASLAYFASATK